MTEESTDEGQKSARAKMGDGIRQGIGVLSAFKDALEETIQEARDRGDLSAERAKELMKNALGKAQAAASDARGRFDFATEAELEALQGTVDSLQERIAALEARLFGDATGGPKSDDGDDPEREDA